MADSRAREVGPRIIIDSNVLISAENLGVQEDAHSSAAAEFFRLASTLGFPVVVSAATRADITRAPEDVRRKRERQLTKYSILEPIVPAAELAARARYPSPMSSNDAADLEVLAALDVNAAEWLVTEDARLISRAINAGFADRVFGLAEASDLLRSFLARPSSLPDVRTVKGYAIDLTAPIFESLRADYAGFDEWWKAKVAREHRNVLLLGQPGAPEGLSVVKPEFDAPHGLGGRVLKVCTFKIAEDYAGSRRGELLLKATIDYARANRFERAYTEVLPSKPALVTWLEGFGFVPVTGASTSRGGLVLQKGLVPPDVGSELSDLEFNTGWPRCPPCLPRAPGAYPGGVETHPVP
jgi:GNAT superfamily N-acetyltransferase